MPVTLVISISGSERSASAFESRSSNASKARLTTSDGRNSPSMADPSSQACRPGRSQMFEPGDGLALASERMAVGHTHGHLPGAHANAPSAATDGGRLRIALALILGFMAVEVVVGILASSLALLSDAGHMLTDAGAIAFALIAIRLAARPPQGDFTFGLKRAEILAAQLNGAALLVLGIWIVYEAITRLASPPDTAGGAVLAVAIIGIGVNLVATLVLAGANRKSLNIEGAYQHIFTDLIAFVATAIAGAVILIAGFDRADGIAALFIAAIMFRSAYALLRDSGRILLEAAPAGLDPDQIGRAMAADAEVENVHDLHLWE